MGLSIRVRRRYGFAGLAHFGRILSRIVGWIGAANSVITDGCGSVGLGGVVIWRKWDRGCGRRKDVRSGVRPSVACIRVREHDALAKEDSIFSVYSSEVRDSREGGTVSSEKVES